MSKVFSLAHRFWVAKSKSFLGFHASHINFFSLTLCVFVSSSRTRVHTYKQNENQIELFSHYHGCRRESIAHEKLDGFSKKKYIRVCFVVLDTSIVNACHDFYESMPIATKSNYELENVQKSHKITLSSHQSGKSYQFSSRAMKVNGTK